MRNDKGFGGLLRVELGDDMVSDMPRGRAGDVDVDEADSREGPASALLERPESTDFDW